MQQALHRPTIMVVDDDIAIHESFDAILGDQCRMLFFEDGETAVDHLRWAEPDLLFLDVHMPGIGGQGVMRFMSSKHINIPVVLISADVEELQKQWHEVLDNVQCLQKPLDIDAINAIVKAKTTQLTAFDGNA